MDTKKNYSQYILALDQGTSSSRAIVFDHDGNICSVSQHEFPQIFPHSGWVEHDPHQIWASQASVIAEAISKIGINGHNIAAIGITNQRETTIVWDSETGEPIYNAIVWQDRRTSEYCDRIRAEGKAEMIRQKTGLIIDAYFSATKIRWILGNVPGAREKAEAGRLRFGTVDSWLVACLTRNRVHITDVTNASRTMLFNIHTLEWDRELLDLFGIPASMMPEVKSSSEIYGYTTTTIFAHEVPIAGIAGDQQAALFGQMCVEPGAVKNTYGTGGFLLMNSGDRPIDSKNRLLTTIAWGIGGKVTYALEGSIFVAGSVVQWLRDNLKCINSSSDVRAALEGIAYQTYDIVKAMERDSGLQLANLKVDGGASRNNLLMQFQSDILDTEVLRPKVTETTALGAAYLAGLAIGYWSDIEELRRQWQVDRRFNPQTDAATVKRYLAGWHDAVHRVLTRDTYHEPRHD